MTSVEIRLVLPFRIGQRLCIAGQAFLVAERCALDESAELAGGIAGDDVVEIAVFQRDLSSR